MCARCSLLPWGTQGQLLQEQTSSSWNSHISQPKWPPAPGVKSTPPCHFSTHSGFHAQMTSRYHTFELLLVLFEAFRGLHKHVQSSVAVPSLRSSEDSPHTYLYSLSVLDFPWRRWCDRCQQTAGHPLGMVAVFSPRTWRNSNMEPTWTKTKILSNWNKLQYSCIQCPKQLHIHGQDNPHTNPHTTPAFAIHLCACTANTHLLLSPVAGSSHRKHISLGMQRRHHVVLHHVLPAFVEPTRLQEVDNMKHNAKLFGNEHMVDFLTCPCQHANITSTCFEVFNVPNRYVPQIKVLWKHNSILPSPSTNASLVLVHYCTFWHTNYTSFLLKFCFLNSLNTAVTCTGTVDCLNHTWRAVELLSRHQL